MSSFPQTPFESIEGAHQYIRLLLETITEGKRDVQLDLEKATRGTADRHVEALRLVEFKLNKLEQLLQSSSRVLNDLRSLRRLLLEERAELVPVNSEKKVGEDQNRRK